jgi:hypothetical protein
MSADFGGIPKPTVKVWMKEKGARLSGRVTGSFEVCSVMERNLSNEL